ncbi:hypothetical protein FA09DRAFT_70118 [Tilletiopsis washingtonensis]|uniref:Uncharacterized protein n=1 Tax=Tilletiopsis washingtonensis TaxID=58919 RepID=A0A316Z525_9BASI|nr:hypothetical protein FA09DRAFT_70118 [Tilletiopsis washingtonensis]PWN96860.1 hypothetical protein FA09DRAFT_70118 [Tilletiopsis washingtonensis]
MRQRGRGASFALGKRSAARRCRLMVASPEGPCAATLCQGDDAARGTKSGALAARLLLERHSAAACRPLLRPRAFCADIDPPFDDAAFALRIAHARRLRASPRPPLARKGSCLHHARERSWSLAIHGRGQSALLLPPVAPSKREEAFVASARGSHNVSVSAGMRDAAGSMQPARTRSAGPFRRGSEAANGGCRCARTRGGIDSTPASRCSRQAAAASEGWMRCSAL